MLTAEGFQIGRGIDIGDRGNFGIGIQHHIEFPPGALHLVKVGHVSHLAARRQVRKYDHLLGTGDDVGHFRHEMHAAKNDVFGIRLGSLA